jgi:hypothetical protein
MARELEPSLAPMGAAAWVERTAAVIARHRFALDDERTIGDGIAIVLERAEIPFRREVRLGEAGVIDFVVGERVGLELKSNGSPAAVLRQLRRYADSAAIEALMLVSRRAAHRALPTTLRGKPLAVVHLLSSAF